MYLQNETTVKYRLACITGAYLAERETAQCLPLRARLNKRLKVMQQGHPRMESFQMRPKHLKCIILCLESLFS